MKTVSILLIAVIAGLFTRIESVIFNQTTYMNTPNYEAWCEVTGRGPPNPRNCLELHCRGYRLSGIYDVYPILGLPNYKISVYCDQVTNGGGYTVFQRRMDGTVDFFRNWQNYKLGFGNVNAEHWLGLENIRAILDTYSAQEFRIDLEDFDNAERFAQYTRFEIGREDEGYSMKWDRYSGDAGDALGFHKNSKFSTYDRDQDTAVTNCADTSEGGFWYSSCYNANLNGPYSKYPNLLRGNGIIWRQWRGDSYSLKTTEMKARPDIFA